MNKNKQESLSLANPNSVQPTAPTISELNSVSENQSDNIDNILRKYKPTPTTSTTTATTINNNNSVPTNDSSLIGM